MSNTLERFIRWFVIPFNTIGTIPRGDAAFVAFSIGCSLCERYHRIDSKTQDKWDSEEFKDWAAEHLNVDTDFFYDFWDVFRNGIQHQGQPKWRKGNGADRKPYKWEIDGTFHHYPTIRLNAANEEVICINPWAFTQHYIDLFLAEPAKLDDAVHHAFGDIHPDQTAILHSERQPPYKGPKLKDTN